MPIKTMIAIVSLFVCTIFFIPSFLVYAVDDHNSKKWYNKILDNDDDSDHHQRRKQERKRDGNHSAGSIKIVKNTVYQEECGACHFAYQTELMPAASWSVLMENLDDHFGETI